MLLTGQAESQNCAVSVSVAVLPPGVETVAVFSTVPSTVLVTLNVRRFSVTLGPVHLQTSSMGLTAVALHPSAHTQQGQSVKYKECLYHIPWLWSRITNVVTSYACGSTTTTANYKSTEMVASDVMSL